jgi:asparagine synthase (glutamine-hydrolysing)
MEAAYDVEHWRAQLIMVYNGELYNTEELRQKLLYKGYKLYWALRHRGVLKAYAEWGESCTDMLNGIYALLSGMRKRSACLWQGQDRGQAVFLLCADGVFIFASELKALLEHPSVKPEIDAQGIAEIILVGPGRTPGCGVFKNIEELKPGCCGFYDKAGLRIKQYWALKDKEHTDNFEQTAEKVRFLVEDAIERQLVSDVPICTFLSGGLDSSIIPPLPQKDWRIGERGLTPFRCITETTKNISQPQNSSPAATMNI